MPTIEVRPDSEDFLQQVADSLLKSRKIVVITGAGISTNSGIPDFRSENGLYSLIQAQFDAANRLTALQAADATNQPRSRETSEPPPTKRRRISHDIVESGDTSAQGLTHLGDPGPLLAEEGQIAGLQAKDDSPSCLEDDDAVPELSDSSNEGSLPQESELPIPDTTCLPALKPATSTPSKPSRPHALAHSSPGIRSGRAAATCSPLRRALHASAIASCSTQERTSLQDGNSDMSQMAAQESSPKRPRPAPCLSCADRFHGLSLPRRAASVSPIRQRVIDEEMASGRPRRTRSASPPRRPGNCQCSNQLSALFLQLPQVGQHTPPRRSESLMASSPLSPPPSTGERPTPQSSHFRPSLRTPSRLVPGALVFNSSPLSSPPPVLFDPYQESSSSTSHQGSSDAESASSSETDETPPSSVPSLASQTSNPSRTSLPNLKGRDLFDVSIWSDPIRTSVFYTFTTTLRQKSRDVEPTASHHFISHLRDRGKLVRCYTQNIDQIEEKVGLSTSLQQGPGSRGRFSRKSTGGFSTPNDATEGKDTTTRRNDPSNGGVECVFLHGSLQSLRCFLCGQVCEWEEEDRYLETLSGRQPECPHCAGATAARQERGKRALGVGKLRPDIVLYGEEHPNAHLIDPLVKHDLALYPDFMLILGTSLKVHGLKVIVREFAKAVHCKGGKVVFVNFTKPPESSWGDIIDYWIQWDCDAWVANLQERIPLLWLPPGTKLSAPSKRKRESSGLEKLSKKRPSLLVKQESIAASQASQTSADASVNYDSGMAQSPTDLEGSSPISSSAKPSKAPLRPMSLREDKYNGAFLTWKISRDLRRLSGSSDELKMYSSPISRTKPAPPPRSLKQTKPPEHADSPSPDLSSPSPAQAPLPTGRTSTMGEAPDTTPPARPSAPRRPRASLPSARPTRGSRASLAQAPPCQSLPLLPRADDVADDAEDNAKTPATAAKAKKRKSPRKSGRGWFLCTADAPEMKALEMRREKNSTLSLLPNPEVGEQPLLAAVKSNPRTRKRKMIDGVEVTLPGTLQRSSPARTPAKTPSKVPTKPMLTPTGVLPRPVPRPLSSANNTEQNKENHGILSPKILSDINGVSMHSLTLPPIRTQPAPLSMQFSPTKLQPMEPPSPPPGPVARIVPNVRARSRGHPLGDAAFAYTDSLMYQLNMPLRPWTPEDQLRQEQAALALSGLRTGRR